MQLLKRFDDGLARGEATLATFFLLSMILAASLQALFRNLATEAEIEAANSVVAYLSWVDPFLQKGTLWLAFLGASLATREGRHIGIDLLPRLASRKLKLVMRGLTGIFAAFVSFFLARAFWSAVLVNANERPADYEVFGDAGAMHVCDASAQAVADAGLDVPGAFCVVRGALGLMGIPVETGQAVLQLIVPVMFVIMSARLLANGAGAFMELRTPDEPKVARSDHPTPESKGSDTDSGEET